MNFLTEIKKHSITFLLFFLCISCFSQDTIPQFGVIVFPARKTFGINWMDYNNDGNQDLFLLGGGSYNRFYHNSGSGFIEITNNLSADNLVTPRACWADYNNDGWVDVFVANGYPSTSSPNHLFMNNGDSTFTQVNDDWVIQDTTTTMNASWVDLENDGDLDMVIVNQTTNNKIYLNQGNGDFVFKDDATIGQNGGSSQVLAWSDYDNDRFMDAYETFAFQAFNRLYQNTGGLEFVTVTEEAGIYEPTFAPGASWGDFNNDGWQDLFVPCQNYLENVLYQNNQDGTFTKRIDLPITEFENKTSLAGDWVDLDNDGDLDLIVVNSQLAVPMTNSVYINQGDGSFLRLTDHPIVNFTASFFTVSSADVDNDGDMDVFIGTEYSENDFLFINMGNDNNWLNVLLKGVYSNRSAIGAKVRIKAQIDGKEVWQMREVLPLNGHAAQGSLNLEFGLGKSEIIDSLVVEWPSGYTNVQTNVAVNQFLEIEETPSAPPKLFIQHPQSVEVCNKEKVEFKVKTISKTPDFQWQIKIENSWINMPDSNIRAEIFKGYLTLPEIDKALNNAYVRCIASDDYYQSIDTSSAAEIIIQSCFLFAGNVFTNNGWLSNGQIFLIPDSSNKTSEFYQAEIEAGRFFVDNVFEGKYFCYAVPTGESSFNYFPTYYLNSNSMETAQTVFVNNDITNHKLFLLGKECSRSVINSYNYLMDSIQIDTLFDWPEDKAILSDIENIGDLDLNGFNDLAIGLGIDSRQGTGCGSVTIMFLGKDNEILSTRLIDKASGDGLDITENDNVGSSIENLGDIDGDGIQDLAVGLPGDDGNMPGNKVYGAIDIWFMNRDGTVKNAVRIDENNGNLNYSLSSLDSPAFGVALTNIGDLDGDSIPEIAVGMKREEIIFILFMNADGTVKKKTVNHFDEKNPVLSISSYFSFARDVETIGDLNNDGIDEIAVGVTSDISNNKSTGAVYILFLNKNGVVEDYYKIGDEQLKGHELQDGDNFGYDIMYLEDYYSIGKPVIAVSAVQAKINQQNKGRVFFITLNEDGSIYQYNFLKSENGELENSIGTNAWFGNRMVDYTHNNDNAFIINSRHGDHLGNSKGSFYLFQPDCDLETSYAFHSISGTIYGGENIIYEGNVFLYSCDNFETKIQKTEIEAGEYVFSSVDPGCYRICAEPEGVSKEVYAKTCFLQSLSANNAHDVQLVTSIKDLNINLMRKDEVLRVQNIDNASFCSVFPNPFSESFQIKSTEKITGITIFNIPGQIVYEKSIPFQTHMEIQSRLFGAGCYLLHIYLANGEKYIQKIIKY